MSGDLTPIYHAVKDTFEESGLEVTERYIGLFTVIFYRSFLRKFVDSFIEPGPPPTGLNTSGVSHAPGASITSDGKAECGTGHSHSASTRTIVIDNTPHICTNCGNIIKPNEKYFTRIILSGEDNKLPRPIYEAEHVICPKN